MIAFFIFFSLFSFFQLNQIKNQFEVNLFFLFFIIQCPSLSVKPHVQQQQQPPRSNNFSFELLINSHTSMLLIFFMNFTNSQSSTFLVISFLTSLNCYAYKLTYIIFSLKLLSIFQNQQDNQFSNVSEIKSARSHVNKSCNN